MKLSRNLKLTIAACLGTYLVCQTLCAIQSPTQSQKPKDALELRAELLLDATIKNKEETTITILQDAQKNRCIRELFIEQFDSCLKAFHTALDRKMLNATMAFLKAMARVNEVQAKLKKTSNIVARFLFTQDSLKHSALTIAASDSDDNPSMIQMILSTVHENRLRIPSEVVYQAFQHAIEATQKNSTYTINRILEHNAQAALLGNIYNNTKELRLVPLIIAINNNQLYIIETIIHHVLASDNRLLMETINAQLNGALLTLQSSPDRNPETLTYVDACCTQLTEKLRAKQALSRIVSEK